MSNRIARHLPGCDTRGGNWICAQGCPVAAAVTAPSVDAIAQAQTGVAHLAGPPVTFNAVGGQILRQRCSWCGTTLVDVNLARTSVPIGQDPTYPTWEVGAFVEVHEPDKAGGMATAADWEYPAPVPDNACMRMPLEVTA